MRTSKKKKFLEQIELFQIQHDEQIFNAGVKSALRLIPNSKVNSTLKKQVENVSAKDFERRFKRGA